MSRQSQREAVLARLKQGPATTWQLGYGLGICCVTKRISELRAEGHVITKSEQRLSGKRVVTYRLETNGQRTEAQNERVNDDYERVAKCSNCGNLVNRKRKARLPLPGEKLFCKQSCHDAYWNGKKRQAELFTDSQQISTGYPQPHGIQIGDL